MKKTNAGTPNSLQARDSAALDNFISRLDRVRKTGTQSYMACCPAHEDRNSSLSIRATDDGRVLLHCFAECPVEEVVAAVGLTMSDLFPPRLLHHAKPERHPFSAATVLRAVAFETIVVVSAGVSMLAGQYTEVDRERLILAVSRIQAALTYAGVSHE